MPPLPCAWSTGGVLGDDDIGDVFDGTGNAAGISSTWPDSNVSLDEDIGNRGIFC